MGVGGQRHAPAALLPAKTRYPLYGRLGGPQGRSGQVRKVSPPTGTRSLDRSARSESLYLLSYPGPPGSAVFFCIYLVNGTFTGKEKYYSQNVFLSTTLF